VSVVRFGKLRESQTCQLAHHRCWTTPPLTPLAYGCASFTKRMNIIRSHLLCFTYQRLHLMSESHYVNLENAHTTVV
jgi:hypothetical protein